ncbi:hypothetical protein [Mycolicibacterium sp. J2]|uniref:hypothetical protein n=1 Tax=Mycolicibacterium sp. J2 TaxID=2993511 RepID=UPI00224B493C|nr:hypothetical protein [Mycolicibacterium sp. J2]MCX2712043.1 hypothetical protein [Mycolicibacterium sp. J2]
MDCHICALHDADQTDQAVRLEGIRHRRLQLAILTNSLDVTSEINAEIGGCVGCLTRLAASTAAINAAITIAAYRGDRAKAVEDAQRTLMEYIDEQPSPAG